VRRLNDGVQGAVVVIGLHSREMPGGCGPKSETRRIRLRRSLPHHCCVSLSRFSAQRLESREGWDDLERIKSDAQGARCRRR